MSLPATITRIDQIRTLLTSPATPVATPATGTGSAFADRLQAASTALPSTSAAVASNALSAGALGPGLAATALPIPSAARGSGPAALASAQAEVGVAEQPPGSNDAPRIAEYRQATAGSGVGPWCGYFVSWAARQAGTPLGEQGQGLGSVAAIADWAQRTGRSLPAGSVPAPGDLIVWGSRHVGIVESVGSDGSIHTVEGNSSDAVSRRSYGADGGGATSYVRLG